MLTYLRYLIYGAVGVSLAFLVLGPPASPIKQDELAAQAATPDRPQGLQMDLYSDGNLEIVTPEGELFVTPVEPLCTAYFRAIGGA